MIKLKWVLKSNRQPAPDTRCWIAVDYEGEWSVEIATFNGWGWEGPGYCIFPEAKVTHWAPYVAPELPDA